MLDLKKLEAHVTIIRLVELSDTVLPYNILSVSAFIDASCGIKMR